jgi:choline-glycine betaine transporter
LRGSTNSTVDKGVFGVAVVISVAFLLWGVLAKDNLAGVTSAVLDFFGDSPRGG